MAAKGKRLRDALPNVSKDAEEGISDLQVYEQTPQMERKVWEGGVRAGKGGRSGRAWCRDIGCWAQARGNIPRDDGLKCL